MSDVDIVNDGIELGKKAREHLKTDPNAVRALAANNVEITEAVTVYPNKVLNKKFADLKAEFPTLADIKRNTDESDADWEKRVAKAQAEVDAYDAEITDLKNQIDESSVTFELKSVSKRTIKNLRKAARAKYPLPTDGEIDADEEERDDYYRASIVAAHLISDSYSIDDILNIMDNWPTSCWARLWTTAQAISIGDDFLAKTLDADFL